MTNPRDMGPGDLAPNTAPPPTRTTGLRSGLSGTDVPDTPDEARQVERNAFYNGLAPGAKERFLAALEAAAARGADEETAWADALAAIAR